MLLTGSNMSGKTTFIRAIGLNAILSQTLYTCFAKQYVAPFFKIYTSIRISDDLLELCDTAVEIDMAGVKNSLNVAVAFGVMAYQIRSHLKFSH